MLRADTDSPAACRPTAPLNQPYSNKPRLPKLVLFGEPNAARTFVAPYKSARYVGYADRVARRAKQMSRNRCRSADIAVVSKLQ